MAASSDDGHDSLLGLFSLYRINLSELPKIDIGEVVISTYYPGASPEDVGIEGDQQAGRRTEGDCRD